MSMLRSVVLAALLAVSAAPLAGQRPPASLLRAGPMVGHATMREVALWTQTTGPATVQFVYWDSLAPTRRYTTATVRTAADLAFTARLAADSVLPGHVYGYELRLNGVAIGRPYRLRFATPALWQYRTEPPPLRIALGSCFYVNEARFDRPGTPYGSHYEILTAIAATRPDVMLWTGDNTYLREADFDSRTGVFHRYTHSRALPELQPLLGVASHYATWDDHDFGPNDSDGSYVGRQLTRRAFELFWANPPLGADGGGGVTSTFDWHDVQVVLLDDRWYRSAQDRTTGAASFLGERQIDWLLNVLKASRATFKLVVVGGQVVNNSATFENYATYGAERQRLLDLLARERVPGVLFLSGDKHWTELSRMERPGTYPLYDLTVSPLTSGTSTGWQSEKNDHRVDGTLLQEHNFATLDFSGPRAERLMTITIRDAGGGVRWTRAIRATELK